MGKKSGRGPYKAGSPVNKRKAVGWFGSQPEKGLKNTGSLNALRSARQRLAFANAAFRPQAGSEDYGMARLEQQWLEAKRNYDRISAETTDPDGGTVASGGFTGGTGHSYRPAM